MSEGQENTTNETQESQPVAQEDANVDYKSLYLDEVQNAKKLRKRAQESETQNKEFLTSQETQKVKSMKEQERYKELSETLQAKLDEVSPFKDKWESHESSRRDSLLAKLPEDDREGLQGETLKTLEYIVSLKEESKPSNPAHTPGLSRKVDSEVPDNPFNDMDKQGRQKNWDNILTQYTDKHKKVNLKQ